MQIERQGLWAVDIDALSGTTDPWRSIKDGFEVSALPRKQVYDSDPARSAVLSWRWDRDLFEGRSRNVALALHHAVQTGIQLLFVDLVTVDQSLRPEELLSKVAALSELYRKLPVLVAGDRPDVPPEEWDRTFRRPWLLYEARSYAVNPKNVTYLGCRDSSNCDVDPAEFAQEVEAIRASGFAIYIFYVLWGYIGMQDPGDFKYILPPFYSLFAYLQEQMSRNDFLFSVFLLCAIHQPTQLVDDGNGGQFDNGFRINFDDLRLDSVGFQRYSLGAYESSRSFETKRTISLDKTPIAEWRSKMTSSYDRNWIKVLPGADSCLLDAMDVPSRIREEYETRRTERLACLFLDPNATRPTVSQFTAYINDRSWVPFSKRS